MRFLLATIDGGGTVPPELGLASRLVRRGHAVRVLADPTVEPGAHAARCAFSPWRRAPHVRSLEEQTALITDMERRNVFRQFVFARDRIICGPAKEFAADVVETVREDPVDAAAGRGADTQHLRASGAWPAAIRHRLDPGTRTRGPDPRCCCY